jgi:four helix bundle protein
MATFRRFEDIEAWQKARELAHRVYLVSSSGSFAKDYGLKDQIRRASVSIMANIAEGFGRNGRREFLQFLSNAKGSVAEVQSHLYLAVDLNYIDTEGHTTLYAEADRVGKMIGGLMTYLRNTDIKGIKYAEQATTPSPTANRKP